MILWWEDLKERVAGPREPLPCPYCSQTDRNRVTDSDLRFQACHFDYTEQRANGIIGADPPCVCDDYFTGGQLGRLGIAGLPNPVPALRKWVAYLFRRR